MTDVWEVPPSEGERLKAEGMEMVQRPLSEGDRVLRAPRLVAGGGAWQRFDPLRLRDEPHACGGHRGPRGDHRAEAPVSSPAFRPRPLGTEPRP